MDEFAAVSGVSRPTVAKYFHDPSSVRESTRLRIETSLARVDYRPNLFAVNLNRQHARIVGVVVPSMTDPFYAEITRQVERHCIDAGYLAIVLSSHGDRQFEIRALRTLRSLKAAGIILAPLGLLSDETFVRRLKAAVPIVFLDAAFDDEAPFVGTDNAHSVAVAVDYLARTGDRPCFLEMPAVNRNAAERREAYCRAMDRLGLRPDVMSPEAGVVWDFERVGYEAALARIDGGGFPTRTILCANDRLAFGVLAAAHERGIDIGRRGGLRVAGHDDHPLSRYACPALTTVAQDYDRLGSLSIEMLLARIAGTAHGVEQVRLGGTLVRRASA